MRWTVATITGVLIAMTAPATSFGHALPYKRTCPTLSCVFKAQTRNLDHVMYVAKHGRGEPKRWSVKAVVWLSRLRSETLAKLAPQPPPHHRLWMCIHGGEGAWHDRDSGHNGHYGGLQMHPGWGHGTSYYASDSSQMVQEWAAERAYRESGYSSFWLHGQWGQTIGPCWGYA